MVQSVDHTYQITVERWKGILRYLSVVVKSTCRCSWWLPRFPFVETRALIFDPIPHFIIAGILNLNLSDKHRNTSHRRLSFLPSTLEEQLQLSLLCCFALNRDLFYTPGSLLNLYIYIHGECQNLQRKEWYGFVWVIGLLAHWPQIVVGGIQDTTRGVVNAIRRIPGYPSTCL